MENVAKYKMMGDCKYNQAVPLRQDQAVQHLGVIFFLQSCSA